MLFLVNILILNHGSGQFLYLVGMYMQWELSRDAVLGMGSEHD